MRYYLKGTLLSKSGYAMGYWRIIPALLTVMLAGPAIAGRGDTVDVASALADTDCATLACRPAGSLDGLDMRENKVSLPVPRSPYVTADGTIIVFPGETLVFTFANAGETPGKAVYVANPTGKEVNTLTVTYEQKGTSNMLFLEHSMGGTLKLDATMTAYSGSRYLAAYTSTCPLRPGLKGNEMWMQPLGPILLANLRFIGTGNSFVCD